MMRVRSKRAAVWHLLLGVFLCAADGFVRAQDCVRYETQKIVVSDTSFSIDSTVSGSEVAIDGMWAAMGVELDNAGLNNDVFGSVYLLRRDINGTPLDPSDDFWVQATKLVVPGGRSGDRFGRSISIRGDRLAAGAIYDPTTGVSSGVVYLYQHDDAGTPLVLTDDLWILEGNLTPSDGAANDDFGDSIAQLDAWLFVGAPGDDGVEINTGSVYVYRTLTDASSNRQEARTWVQVAKLTRSDEALRDHFGKHLAASGDWLVVGRPHDEIQNVRSGSIHLFRLDDNQTPSDFTDDFWLENVKLVSGDARERDLFGISVSISGDWILVGAMLVDDVGDSAGAAYFFRRDDNGTPTDPTDDQWVEHQKVFGSDTGSGDLFGLSVSIRGDHAVVGAAQHGGVTTGAAYLFVRHDRGTPLDLSDDLWEQSAEFRASDAENLDTLGLRVAIDGESLIVGGRRLAPPADVFPLDFVSAYLAPIEAECIVCPTPEPNGCFLDPVGGPCDSNCLGYYYDAGLGHCKAFFYGCCFGNANGFETLDECEATCPMPKDDCFLEADVGRCNDACPRFAFDGETRQCKSFTYSGCGGNSNNFLSRAECEGACVRRVDKLIPTVSQWGLFVTALLIMTAGTLVIARLETRN